MKSIGYGKARSGWGCPHLFLLFGQPANHSMQAGGKS
jgi:hypothetical protein